MHAAPIRRGTPAPSVRAQPDPTTARRPYRARRPSGGLARLLRQPGTDHAVTGDESFKLLLAPAVSALRAHRHYQITNFRGRIPDPNIGAGGQFTSEILPHAPWI